MYLLIYVDQHCGLIDRRPPPNPKPPSKTDFYPVDHVQSELNLEYMIMELSCYVSIMFKQKKQGPQDQLVHMYFTLNKVPY